jgi:hypothetical protein
MEALIMEKKIGIRVGGVFEVVCRGADGAVKWIEEAKNLVVNTGLNLLLDNLLHNTSQVATWWVGLKNSGTPVSIDTLASHGSWTENSNYTGNRKEYEEAAASGKSITNSANKASFSINADSQTIAGAFLSSVSVGTSGTLLCAADFTSAKSADNGDTLEVTYTISAADDGS